MFDPERDDDSGARPFYLRVLAVAAVTAVGCLVLWPSVHGFTAGPDHLSNCLALTDGWHADQSPPGPSALAAAYAVMPPVPTPEQAQDPEFMARWRGLWRAAQSNPAVVRANAEIDWRDGAGACVPESRHRLLVSGIGLATIAGVAAAIAIVRSLRLRAGRRELPATFAAGSVENLV